MHRLPLMMGACSWSLGSVLGRLLWQLCHGSHPGSVSIATSDVCWPCVLLMMMSEFCSQYANMRLVAACFLLCRQCYEQPILRHGWREHRWVEMSASLDGLSCSSSSLQWVAIVLTFLLCCCGASVLRRVLLCDQVQQTGGVSPTAASTAAVGNIIMVLHIM